MVAVADRIAPPGFRPRDVGLTIGLSVLLHALLTIVIFMIPRFQVGRYITVPVTYSVSLVASPPGGGGPTTTPSSPSAPAPAQVGPPQAARSAPAVRPAPAPRPVPSEELTLPGRRPTPKSEREREPSLRPPPAEQEKLRPATPTPIAPAPLTPPLPVPTAPPVASAGPAATPSTAIGKGGGVEVAGTGSGSGKGAGGGDALASYLTLLDWKIQQNWIPAGASTGPETVVAVKFRVLRSGQVRDVELETSSGNAGLDASALRAIRQSVPLPPFPNLLTEPYLDLRYRFVMERG